MNCPNAVAPSPPVTMKTNNPIQYATRDWKNWASRHPFIANLATALVVFLTCLTSMAEDPWFVMGPALVSAIIIVGVVVYVDSKKTIQAMLALCLSASSALSAEPQSPPEAIDAGVVAGCALIAGTAAVTIIWVIPFCKKHFDRPKQTNSEAWLFAAGGEDSSAAIACSHYKPVCGDDFRFYSAQNPPETTLVIEVSGMVREHLGFPFVEEIGITSRRTGIGESELSSWLASLGLRENLGSGSSFGRNGQPCSESDSPYRFRNDNSVEIMADGPKARVAIERSFEIGEQESWQVISAATLPMNHRLSVIYLPEPGAEKAFYRMRVVE